MADGATDVVQMHETYSAARARTKQAMAMAQQDEQDAKELRAKAVEWSRCAARAKRSAADIRLALLTRRSHCMDMRTTRAQSHFSISGACCAALHASSRSRTLR